MNFESKKAEKIFNSILYGLIAIIPLYIAEYLYTYHTYNLTLINKDDLVVAYNFMQIAILSVTHYLLTRSK